MLFKKLILLEFQHQLPSGIIKITKASEIPKIIAKAFFIAKSGRPGPVLIDITKDAQFELMNFSYSKHQNLIVIIQTQNPNLI